MPVAVPEPPVLDVTVVLLDGGYASEAIGPIEVFHSAGRLWNAFQGQAERPRFRVTTASLDGSSVCSLYGLRIAPEAALGDIARTDLVVVPASGWQAMDRAVAGGPLIPWLRDSYARGTAIAGICIGVAFLAEAGLLDGRQATTHWAAAEMYRQRYPKVLWRPEQLITEDAGIYCCGGVYASMDLSLYLVQKLCGHEIALQCAKSLLLNMPRSHQSGYSVIPLSRPHNDDRIRRAESFLQDSFRSGPTIEELAVLCGMSPRNFVRRFKIATGRMPGEYVHQLRMARAKEMLEMGQPVQSVCSNVGYEDIGFFRALFRRSTGMTPAEYRSRFAALGLAYGNGAPVAPPGH